MVPLLLLLLSIDSIVYCSPKGRRTKGIAASETWMSRHNMLLSAPPSISKEKTQYSPFSYDPHSAHGPRHWPNKCQTGHRQSPINIDKSLVRFSHLLAPKRSIWYRVQNSFSFGEFKNNGHSAVFEVDKKGNRHDFGNVLRNVPNFERTDFVFANTHFHVGGVAQNQSRPTYLPEGSEHSVDGRFYDGEIHLVHWKRDEHTQTFEEAASSQNGLVVLGIFFRVVNHNNGEVDRIISQYVSNITKIGSVVPAVINPSQILPDDGLFYSYKGSLTTPPCTENVFWIVYRSPITINRKSYEFLLSLQTGETKTPPLIKFGNNRPVQRHHIQGVASNFHLWQ